MKYYHPKRSALTTYERKMAITLVQGYEDMMAQLDSLIQKGVIMDGQPHGTTPGDPTGMAVLRRSEKSRYVDAVKKALLELQPEYRDVVYRWVKTGKPLTECGGEYAHRNTYSNHKERFLYTVALYAGIHEDWR